MIALVTGGAGFIGSHMVEFLLKKNFEVRVIDNFTGGREENLSNFKSRDLKVEKIDIRNLKSNANIFKDVDYTFHFAGIGDIVPSIENPKEYAEVNTMGTIKVLEACRNFGIKKIIYAASSSCYGLAKTPTSENHTIDTKYPYALSKFLGEQCCFHWEKVYGLKCNSIRIFNAYGTRSRTSGAYGAVFGVFLKQKLSNKPITIVGDGEQMRDFIYASDVANAFFLAAETNISNSVFNVGGGNPQKINYLAKLLECKEIEYLPKRPGEPDITFADISKIKEELGWRPVITFEEGVKKVLKNINYWKNAPLWDKESINEATKSWFKFMDN
jgi:UDP-glucose 4-epimerase